MSIYAQQALTLKESPAKIANMLDKWFKSNNIADECKLDNSLLLLCGEFVGEASVFVTFIGIAVLQNRRPGNC